MDFINRPVCAAKEASLHSLNGAATPPWKGGEYRSRIRHRNFESEPNMTKNILLSCCLVTALTTASPQTLPNTDAIRLNNLGVAYMNQARMADALASFRQATARDPAFFAARLNEGIALVNLQRLDEARDVLLDATRQQPNNARAWYNLGITYRTMAQSGQAIEAFEQVNRIDPGDADSLYFLGQLHTQAGRYQQAIAALERCLALDPLHVSAEFGLARAYQLSGNETAAAKHLARFDDLTQSKLGGINIKQYSVVMISLVKS